MSCVMATALRTTQSHCTIDGAPGGGGAFMAAQPGHSTWNPEASYEALECSTATYPAL